MSAVEYEGWRHHFSRCPPGDYHLQMICAVIGAALLSFFGQEARSPYDIAPWLEPPGKREKREAEEAEQQQVALVAFVSTAYQRSKAKE